MESKKLSKNGIFQQKMIKKYLRLIRIILKAFCENPGICFKKLELILKSSFWAKHRNAHSKNVNGVIFKLDFKGDDFLKKNIYWGTYEMGVTQTLQNFLKKGDTFIDVGANIGYISAIGASLVGKEGWVHSFEPVPEFFLKLQNLAELNKDYNIAVNQFALSDKQGQVKIYVSDYSNIGNNTILPTLIDKEKVRKTLLIQTQRLDDYIQTKNIKKIKVIKIDTEGFEYPVLLGLSNFFKKVCFEKKSEAPLVICEIAPAAYQALGYKLEDIFEYMQKFNYLPFSILNPKKGMSLKEISREETINIIFRR